MKNFIFLNLTLAIFLSTNIFASYSDDDFDRSAFSPSHEEDPLEFFGFQDDDVDETYEKKQERSKSEDLTEGKEQKEQVVTGRIRSLSEAAPKEILAISESDLLKMKLSYTSTYEKFSALLAESGLPLEEIDIIINALPEQSRSFFDSKVRLTGWFMRYQEGILAQNSGCYYTKSAQ